MTQRSPQRLAELLGSVNGDVVGTDLAEACHQAAGLIRNAAIEDVMQGKGEVHALDAALLLIRHEAVRALLLHGPYASMHEAHSVMREEFEEFWDEVKRDAAKSAHAEAIQLAATAAKFVAQYHD